MRVITESEGAETVLDGNGSYWVRTPGAFFQIAGVSKECPTEALLVIVADRLRDKSDMPSVEVQHLALRALSILDGTDAKRFAEAVARLARSPDTKQEEGR